MGLIAFCLDVARGSDPGRDRSGALARWRQDQIGGGDGLDVDMKVDPVEQRARYLRLIICGATRRARAGERRIAEMTATAGVHRRHELNARGKSDMGIG